MDDLLIKYLLEEASPDEILRVDRWLAAEGGNRKYFDQFKAVWQLSNQAARVSAPDSREAYQRLRRRLGEEEERKKIGWRQPVLSKEQPALSKEQLALSKEQLALRRQPILSKGWPVLSMRQIAAVFVGLFCVGVATYVVLKQPRDTRGSQAEVTITQPGKDTLPDGSVVILSPDAKIRYSVGRENGRNIQLEGEAFFSVAADPSHPFIVKASDLTVRVLGTSFKISSGPDSTQVVVETGSVQVQRNNDHVILTAGEKFTAVKRREPPPVVSNRPDSGDRLADSNRPVNHNQTVNGPMKKQRPPPTGFDPRPVMRSIIEDLVKEKIIVNKDSLQWFGLDNTQFVVDGRAIPDFLHVKFKSKYIRADGLGYYYGPDKGIKVHGTGYFYQKQELYPHP